MPRLRALLLPLVLLALGAAGLLLVLRFRGPGVGKPKGPRVMLQVEPDPSLSPAAARGLDLLLHDHLELHGTCTVMPWMADGDRRLAAVERAGVLQLRLHPRRSGDDLALESAWSLRRAGAWTHHSSAAAEPLAALEALGGFLPTLRLRAPDEAYAPRGPGFWALSEAIGLGRMKTDDAQALRLARQSAASAPRCATARATLALALLRSGVEDPGHPAEMLEELEEALRLSPGHPRISYVAASILVEMGRHRDALELLRPAVAAHPDLPDPLQGVVYAARTSGLLDLAGRAHRAEERLLLGPPPRLPLLVLLYRREFIAFERHCREGESQSPTLAHFYLGYLALARGATPEAKAELRQAWHPVDPGWEEIGSRARIWSLHLDGRRDEALAALADLERQRAGARAPDGEFTFMLAEAHGLLGDPDGALDQAQRALAQGFACTDWFERSPFLEPMRRHPRWFALRDHLQARQKLLEERFTPESFGL
ncbi:MAG TPA: tetratricopeptide repeat protein [Holophagaceae bacterium]|nr:tetratricopeptide repeat protein [Holophagaceae bacterium]